MNMKIAYLFGSLNRGGTETLMLDVCRNLQQADSEAIGVYRKKGVLEDDFLSTKIPFYFLPILKNRLRYIYRLRKLLIKNQITIVHAQQPIDALYAYFACLGTRIKILLTMHGFDVNVSRRLLSFILKRTTANVYVSYYQKKYYVDKYKLKADRQLVVYNGIDFDKLSIKQDTSKDIRTELNLSQGTILLGMVGNFNLVRNQMFVCRFLKLLHEQGVDFHFVFAGKRIESMADRFDNCVAYCQDHHLSSKVTFLGVRNDVPSILQALDAFVYATEHDTFGIAVAEAIAAGVPVFVNDWAVMHEITEQGALATLYRSDNEQDLLKKFLVFLKHRVEVMEASQRQSMLVKQKYGIKQHIINLKDIYKEYA